MEKTTLYLPEQLQHELRETAHREGRSQAELIRSAIDAYLRGRPRPRPRSIGIVSDDELSAEDAKAWVHDRWSGRGAA